MVRKKKSLIRYGVVPAILRRLMNQFTCPLHKD